SRFIVDFYQTTHIGNGKLSHPMEYGSGIGAISRPANEFSIEIERIDFSNSAIIGGLRAVYREGASILGEIAFRHNAAAPQGCHIPQSLPLHFSFFKTQQLITIVVVLFFAGGQL